MSQNNFSRPKAIILDCEGAQLTAAEKALFKKENPCGFILFQRNCESPAQVKALVKELRDAVGRPNAPILIDQEGGSVSRLKKPKFQEFMGASSFKKLAEIDPEKGKRAVYLNALMMARQLSELGITVNCTPVVDVPVEGSHEFLAKHRVYGACEKSVLELGERVCQGHIDMNVTPILKHIPGHGRATVDSHLGLPVVDAMCEDIKKRDAQPFKKMPNKNDYWAMTAHVIYKNIDDKNPATLSNIVIQDTIRKDIGFDGVLIADDISMKALKGDMPSLAVASIQAGCDLTLLCNQNFETRRSVLESTPEISLATQDRLRDAEEARQMAKKQVDIEAISTELKAILDEANIAYERECNQNIIDPTLPEGSSQGKFGR